MSRAPRAVVFDLGKVLVDFDYGLAVRAIAAGSRGSMEAIQGMLEGSPLLAELECGRLSPAAFYQRFCSDAGFHRSEAEFRIAFGDIFKPVEAMVRFQEHLKKLGVPRYIFSNTNDLAVCHIRQSYPFFSTFDGYIFSYEHGSLKPEPALYAVVERITGAGGEDLFYLDDRPENVATARARCWRTLCHETPEKTLSRIEAEGWWPSPAGS